MTRASAAAALALFVAALPAGCGGRATEPAIRALEIEAAFDARLPQAVGPGTPVRVAGVAVGTVTKVEPTPHGAVVRISIRSDLVAVHANATILVRPRIFLEGRFFLDLSPGTPSSPRVPNGARLPATHTGFRALP